jgi:hypothetical protein
VCLRSFVMAVLVVAGGACDRRPASNATTTQPIDDRPVFLQAYARIGSPLGRPSQSQFIVCLFARTDCPVSNSYAPEVRRIYEKFSPRGVGFYLVYPDPDETAAMIEKHLKDYSYPFAAFRDPKHELVKLAGAKITPEAAVFDREGKLLYRGRIDDRYVDFGKMRLAPTVRDLEQALEAVLAGKPAPAAGGPAIGCFIADVK